jgi:hypothetical protein
VSTTSVSSRRAAELRREDLSIITRQAIRRGSFPSVADLVAAIRRFCEAWNERCQPFVWVNDADDIMVKATRKRTPGTEHWLLERIPRTCLIRWRSPGSRPAFDGSYQLGPSFVVRKLAVNGLQNTRSLTGLGDAQPLAPLLRAHRQSLLDGLNDPGGHLWGGVPVVGADRAPAEVAAAAALVALSS